MTKKTQLVPDNRPLHFNDTIKINSGGMELFCESQESLGKKNIKSKEMEFTFLRKNVKGTEFIL